MKLALLLLLIPSLSFGAVKAVTGEYEKKDTVVINKNFRELQQGQTITKLQSMFRYKVGTFTSASGTGNQSITGVGFKPRLIILGGDTGAASTARFSLGWGTVDDQAAVLGGAWADDTDTLGGMTTISTAVFKRVDDSGNATALATIASFDADGFTLNWSVAQSITIAYIAFE